MSTQIAELLKTRLASIENTDNNINTSIDIPVEIDNLIDNKMYRNKFRYLIRQGHLQPLLRLAAMSVQKDAPSRWFAIVTSKKNWERTLAFLAKLSEMAAIVDRVMERLNVGELAKPLVYKAVWVLGVGAERIAVTAQEVGRDRLKLFAWLYGKQAHKLAQPAG